MRLHVGVIGPVERLHAINGELFDYVNVLTATVIALARIAFGVLVGEHRALRLHDEGARVVFRCDELNMLFLPNALGLHNNGDFGVELSEAGVGFKHLLLRAISKRNYHPQRSQCSPLCRDTKRGYQARYSTSSRNLRHLLQVDSGAEKPSAKGEKVPTNNGNVRK